MNTNIKTSQRGIGVIEVMVAAAIFALGIVALIQLQGVLFKNSSAAQARSIAATLAEGKLEDLRSFDDGTTFSYLDIIDNAGGDVASGTQTIGNTEYTLTWDVTGFYYNSGVLTSIDPADSSVEHKSVEISVAWVDTDGTAQTYTIDALINSNAGTSGGLLANSTGGSGEKPDVPHVELTAPDVLRVKVKDPPPESFDGTDAEWNALTEAERIKEYAKLGWCNVETYGATESPDPDLDTNSTLDNVIVRFASSKYRKYNPCTFDYANDTIDTIDTSTTELVKIQEEEFATVNCECELAASGAGFDQSGASVTKARTGVKTGPANQQNEFCDLCCRDHHENTTGDYQCNSGTNPEYCIDPFRTAGSDYAVTDHKHYLRSDLSIVAGEGDTYSEVCRLKRVDGFYRVVPDWKMIAHNVMVEDEFNAAAAQSDYESYLGTQINQYLQGNAVSSWSYASAAVPLGDEQMMSRSIYVDYMTAAEITAASPATNGDEVDINVDFYEYKTTQLADWTTEQGANTTFDTSSPCDPDAGNTEACVDSPTIAAIVNAPANSSVDKGVYRYNTLPTDDLTIVSTIEDSNSGVVDFDPIDPGDNVELAASYDVAYGGTPPPSPTRSIQMATTASLTCPPQWGNGNSAPVYSSQTQNNWSDISLSCSPSSPIAAGSCIGYTSDQTNLAVTATLNTAALSCSYNDGSTQTCASIEAYTEAILDGTFSCSVEMTRSGNSAQCDLVCSP